MADKVPATVLKEAAEIGAKAEREKIQEKAKRVAIESMQKTLRRTSNDLKKARENANVVQIAANVVQIATASGAAVLGGMAGFKIQKALTDTTKDWVIEAGEGVDPATIGTPNTAAMVVKDVLPPTVGLVIGIAGAFVDNGTVSAALMGAGFGIAGGSLTSSVLDKPA